MTDNPVREVRRLLRGLGRPLTAREAVLIAAMATGAAAPQDHRRTDLRGELVYDVVTDLRDAVTDSTLTAAPGPAIRAIRRLLEAVGIHNGDPEWTPHAAMPPTRDRDVLERAAGL